MGAMPAGGGRQSLTEAAAETKPLQRAKGYGGGGDDELARITEGPGRVVQIRRWLGLNESPDGDTGLKGGEGAVMKNFRVTREGHLQLRPGSATVCRLSDGPVRGLWQGFVEGKRQVLAACGGHLWRITPQEEGLWEKEELGEIHDGRTTFFGFDRKVYLLTGGGYYYWDGAGRVRPVEGYVPLVAVATPPAGGGTELEGLNLLTGKRRQRFSPDGSATVFQLCESDIDEVTAVEGTELSYTVDKKAGKLTFAKAPAAGTDCLTVTYRKGEGQREQVEKMTCAERYSGAADARVFLYGDGSNSCLYSGLEENGRPSAEYFPALNSLTVDSANTPITGMIRHYDRLLCFKSDAAYAISQGSLTLADGRVEPAFYVTTVNREVGNVPLGQVRLVDNDPRTLFAGGCYQWASTLSATRDERNARRLSRRVAQTLAGFDLAGCVTYDDGAEEEYYIACGEKCLVHNYGNDSWYLYEGLDVAVMERLEEGLCFGTGDGRLCRLSRACRNDDARAIDARWESGAMDFDRAWLGKYSAYVWCAIKPEAQALLHMTAETDGRSGYPVKTLAAGLSSFGHASFAHWSFGVNRKPKVIRSRLKVKGCTYWKLILSSRSASATATVLEVDVKARYGGMAK